VKKVSTIDWIPGIESESKGRSTKKSLLLSLAVSFGLFFLLPLSEFVRTEEWIVREVETIPFQSPPPPKTKLEKKVEDLIEKQSTPRPLQSTPLKVKIETLSPNLEVGPGDFKAAFSLRDYNPVASGLEGELVFALHELDRTPNVLKRGSLFYPPHLKRRGLEGEVKLLVQINEKGRVKVLEVVSSTHPDFNESSIKAAEGSTYEAPKRNGEAVQVQFYLPIRYSLLNQ
jgi:TonB family protein